MVKLRLAADADWAGRAVTLRPSARTSATTAFRKKGSRKPGIVPVVVMDDGSPVLHATPTGLADGFGQGSSPARAAMDTRALHPGTLWVPGPGGDWRPTPWFGDARRVSSPGCGGMGARGRALTVWTPSATRMRTSSG